MICSGMAWQDAKVAGEARARAVLTVLRATGQTSVRLPDYADEDAYEFFRGPEKWSWGFRQMVVRAMRRALRKAGVRARMGRVISRADYVRWLSARCRADDVTARREYLCEKGDE